MANYTMDDVKRLRELTGSGMMDCKKALEEAEGDFDKAVEILRIKGAKDVGKRAGRATSNGLIAADGGVMIELDCETDFVAKNDEFQRLAASIVEAAKASGAKDLDALNAAKLGDGTVADAVQALSAKIGEKLDLAKIAVFDGQVGVYLHRRSADLPPAVGVLVEYTGDAEVIRGVGMQIAAMKPRFVSRDEVPAELLDSERRIAEETARAEGKPEAAIDKIVEGRLNGFFKDVILGEQASVQDSKKTVKALLDEANTKVTKFVRFEVGQA